MMRVKVRLEKVANPLEYEADGTYEKGAFYCIRVGDDVVKIPFANIFMVVETYGYHSPKGNPELERDVGVDTDGQPFEQGFAEDSWER